MTEPHSDLEFIYDAETKNLRWREAIRELPWALYHQLRRVLRREPRLYLVVNGRVAARFTSDYDHLAFVTWLEETHTKTYRHGFDTGKEAMIARYIQAAADNAGAAGPA